MFFLIVAFYSLVPKPIYIDPMVRPMYCVGPIIIAITGIKKNFKVTGTQGIFLS